MNKICWVFLILSLGLNMFSIDIYLPAMSSMAQELATTLFMLKFIFILNFVEFSIAPLIWGSFSDIKGRRKAVFASLILAVIGQFLSALSSNVYLLMFSRITQYLGAGALGSIIITLICDNFEGYKRAKAIAMFEMFLPLAVAISPFIGATMLGYIKWRGSFLLFSIIQACCFFGIYFTLPEAVSIEKKIKFKDTICCLFDILKDSINIRIICILGFGEGVLMFFTISSASFYLQTFNLSLTSYGYYQSIPIFFFLLGLAIYRILIKRLGTLKLFKIGLLGYISFGMSFSLLRNDIIDPTPLSLSCLISIMHFFSGFISPSGNTLVLDRIDKNLIGTSAATITSIINLIVGGSMLCGSFLVDADLSVAFFNSILFMVSFVGVLWFTFEKISR